MRNSRAIARYTARTPNNDPNTADCWAGWDDYANGRGFPPAYDAWPDTRQQNYEIGRGRAAAIKAVLGFVPRWRRNWRMNTVLEGRGVEAHEAVRLEHAYRLRNEPNPPMGA